MAEGILEIEDNSFEEEILKSEKPALVDFWAPWCGPCKAIGPIVEELSQNFGEKIKFAKCNVDNNPVTPSKYGIKAIPTLIFLNGGGRFFSPPVFMASPTVSFEAPSGVWIT
ncbi:MAG: thioredoxin [Deltaproteobacteria bacterium]